MLIDTGVQRGGVKSIPRFSPVGKQDTIHPEDQRKREVFQFLQGSDADAVQLRKHLERRSKEEIFASILIERSKSRSEADVRAAALALVGSFDDAQFEPAKKTVDQILTRIRGILWKY